MPPRTPRNEWCMIGAMTGQPDVAALQDPPVDAASPGDPAPPAPALLEENSFCRDLPSAQTASDLFAGEWSSRLEAPYEELTGASAALFDDARIRWCDAQFGGVKDMRVLELGCLEGGHTYMLDRLGAAEVTAVEANRHAFLRCLVVKEILGITGARFLCGDFMAYLRDAVDRGKRWDLCLAVGVLYHQQDPVHLLQLATQVSDRILIWTHYYDPETLVPELAANFPSATEKTTGGFRHTLHRHQYGATLARPAFCGGLDTWASWLSREDIIGAIDHFDFDVLGVAFEHPQHPNGPAFCLAAGRRGAGHSAP
jgi:SAM-dependent methyltransferase